MESKKEGFKVVCRFGEPIPTRKDSEKVVIQQVQVGGPNGVQWIEARLLYVDQASGKLKPTKTAISFNNQADLDAVIAALTTGCDEAVANGVFDAPEPEPDDDDEDVIKVVAVKPRHAAFSEAAIIPDAADAAHKARKASKG